MMFKNRRCGIVKGRLSAYIDGELSAEDLNTVESHIKSCSGCHRALAELKTLDPLLREYEIPNIPERLTETIMAEAGKTVTGESPCGHKIPAAWTARIRPAFSRAATAAALIIAVAAGSLMGWNTEHEKADVTAAGNSNGINIEVAYGLDAFSAAPYGSIESAFISTTSIEGD